MGLWHAVQYYDANKLKDELSYEAWPAVSFVTSSRAFQSFPNQLSNLSNLCDQVLKQSGIVTSSLGWSYCLSWTGITLTLLSSLLFLSSAQCIRRQKRAENMANMQYLMPVYDKRTNPYNFSPYGYAYPGYTQYAYPY